MALDNLPTAAPSMGGLSALPPSYDAALDELARERLKLTQRQEALMSELEARKVQPAERMMAFAQGMLTPGRTGSFGEAMGASLGHLQQLQGREDDRATQLARMRAELAAAQFAGAKDIAELVAGREMTQAIGNALGGGAPAAGGAPGGGAGMPPGGAAGMSAAPGGLPPMGPQLQAMVTAIARGNPTAAAKMLAEAGFKEAATPDAIKTMRTYVGMLPRDQQAGAMQRIAETQVYGSPADRMRALVDLGRAVRSGAIPEEQQASLAATLAPPASPATASIAGAPDDVRASLATIQDPAQRAEAEQAFARQLQTRGSIPAEAAVPPSATVAPAPVVPAAGAPTGVRISPEGRETIEVARIKTEQEGRAKQALETRDALRGNADRAMDMRTTARAVNDIIRSKDGSALVGLLYTPGIKNAVLQALQDTSTKLTPTIPDLSEKLRTVFGTQAQLDKFGMLLQNAAQLELEFTQAMSKGQGAITEKERPIFRRAAMDPERNSPDVMLWKAALLNERAKFAEKAWNTYYAFEEAGKGDAARFKQSPEYKSLTREYETRLQTINDRFINVRKGSRE